MAAAKHVKKLERAWETLWQKKHDEILERLEGGGEDQRPEAWAERVKLAEANIERIKKNRDDLKVMINGMKIDDTYKNAEQLKAQLLSQDLQYLKRNHDVLKSKLAQIDFEIGQAAYQIEVQDRASPPMMASTNKRLKYMAAAPWASCS